MAVLLLIRVSQETADDGLLWGEAAPIQHLWHRGGGGHWTPKITQFRLWDIHQSLSDRASLGIKTQDIIMSLNDPEISLLSRGSKRWPLNGPAAIIVVGTLLAQKWSAVVSMAAGLVTPPPPHVTPVSPGAGVSPPGHGPGPGPSSPSVAPVVERSPRWQHPESEYSVLSPESGDNNCNKIQRVIDIQIVFTEFKWQRIFCQK